MQIIPFILVVLAYVVTAILLGRLVWRRSKSAAQWSRALARSVYLAFFFSPTFVACGALAPVPFPILIAWVIASNDFGCGQMSGFGYIRWNAEFVVMPTLLLLLAIYAIRIGVAKVREQKNGAT